MRIRLIIWIMIFALGLLVGDRYGLPGGVARMAEPAFRTVEGWFGGLGEPIPDAGDAASDKAPSPASAAAANAGLRMNAAGLQIIKESEGLRLEAYNLNGQWLIGYGHSRTAKRGMTITGQQADQLLRDDVRASEDAVRRMVKVAVNDNQFSAMVSLAYNMGAGGFSRTSVLSRINKGDYPGAADAFLNHNKGGGRVIEHLTHRREKERALFLTPA